MTDLESAPAERLAEARDPSPAEDRRWSRLPLGVGVVGLLLAALLAPAEPLPLPLWLRWLGAYLLFVLLPGWLLVSLLLPRWRWRSDTWLETGILAVAAGYSLAVLLGLALHALLRPIAPWQIATGGGLLVVGLVVAAARAPSACSPSPCARARGPGGEGSSRLGGAGFRRLLIRAWPVLLLLAVAAPLRLADLGWSEFQGDEARVVLRAMAALQGADGALAAHRKVPGEILLAYLFAGGLGQIVEGIARLPYALAAVGAVLAFYALVRRLLGGPAGLVAGLLLAVNGYFVAFGRILQYDSLAFFLGIAGLLCCWQFGYGDAEPSEPGSGVDRAGANGSGANGSAVRLSEGRPIAWAFLGALLLSGAALVALGAVFLVPPALFLAWPGLMRQYRSWRILLAWGWPAVPGLLAAILVLGAGDPSEGPSGIWSYLGPRLGGERPYWHGVDLLLSADHYLSSPYLLMMLAAGAVALALGVLGVAQAMRGRGAVARLGLALLLAALTWDRPRVALALGAVLVVLLALQAVGRWGGPGLGARVGLLWAAGPLFVHLFLIRVPGTHWREAFPGLIVLLAALVAPILVRRRIGPALGAALGLLILGVGHYDWVTLVQRLPEYQITYPSNRHPLDWGGQEGRGIGGVFGAVHHHGWKALGVLAADGALPGGYATNESPAIAAWYVRQPQGCEGTLAYVFRVPRTPQDRNLAVPVPLPTGYQTRGQVRVRGRTTITIQAPPTSTTRFGDIPADAYEDRFDRELASVWRSVGELYRADLGAAAARRSCVARNHPSRSSVKVG